MNYNIRKASLEDLDQTAALFNLYRIFYRQESDLEKAREFLRNGFYMANQKFF